MSAVCGIYMLTNSVNGKRYIGQSRNVRARWMQHSKANEKSAIARSVEKHGWHSFRTQILEECLPEFLNAREQHWIAALGTLSPAGYNLTTGGCQNKTVSDDVRKIISERTLAGLTPQVLARRNAAMRGVQKSPEWCSAMSERQRNPINVARIVAMSRNQSPETREKIAASKRGKALSAETRAKISATRIAHYGRQTEAPAP